MLIKFLYLLHFTGFILGFAASIANARMGGLVAASAPADQAVLKRFLPRMAPLGQVGVALLWISGLGLLHLKWGSNAGALPWLFHVKMLAVVGLTGAVIRLYMLGRKVAAGDTAAEAQMPTVGKIGAASAGVALLCAVGAFSG
jgi:uncharacterized membrane protein